MLLGGKMYKPLKGICVKCTGCNRLEDENFTGVYRCKWNNEEIAIEQIKEENKNE